MATVRWYSDSAVSKIENDLLDKCESWMRTDVEGDSKELCPVDSGTMRDTHEVQRGDREVVCGVGGPSAPYTRKQHEDGTLAHTVGEDHFLEKAFVRNVPKLQARLKI